MRGYPYDYYVVAERIGSDTQWLICLGHPDEQRIVRVCRDRDEAVMHALSNAEQARKTGVASCVNLRDESSGTWRIVTAGAPDIADDDLVPARS